MARKYNTSTGRWDWCRNEDYQLHTAITLSILTDQRALPSDGIEGNQRGWWASSFSPFRGWQMGSRLWTLRGKPITSQLLNDAKTLTEQALEWLIEDKAVSEIEVVATRRDKENIDLAVSVRGPTSTQAELVDIWRIAIG